MGNNRSALKPIAGKLKKLILLLGSDKDGEVVAAAHAIGRLLAGAKFDFHVLAEAICEPEAPLMGLLGALFEKDVDALIRLGHAEAKFFHTTDGLAFADIQVDTHRETWLLTSIPFSDWLLNKFFMEKQKAPKSTALKDAVRTLSAHAAFTGEQREVHLRIADLGGKVYLDLANQQWQVIEVDANGWRIVNDATVRFRRTPGMLPLPTPQPGGSIDELRPFVNLTDDDFILCVSVLLDTLRAGRPHPVLFLSGEQGAAKSTVADVMRRLVDPNSAALRSLPRTERDLGVSAHNSQVLSFDNLSDITPAISDALCRLSSGASFGTRKLYTNAGEFFVTGSRTIILNGIGNVIDRSDLLDRAMILSLSPIREERRRSEAEFWNAFETARPRILGALLDAAVHGLREMPHVRLQRLPRLADFATWAVACESAYAERDAFMIAFKKSGHEAIGSLLEADCVGIAIIDFMMEREPWHGTATELLAAFIKLDRSGVTKWQSWPPDPPRLSRRLKKLAPTARSVGIEITFGRAPTRAGTRVIELRRTEREERQYHQQRQQPQPDARKHGAADNADGATVQTEILRKKQSPPNLS